MVNASVTTTVAVTSAAGLVLVAMAVAALWQRKRKREAWVPEKWRRIGTLSEIALYPVKSGAGLLLEKADCTEMGLRTTSDHPMRLQDRLFVVVDPEGNMRTARQHQNLLLIKVSKADETSVTFQAPNVEDLTISIPQGGEAKKCFVILWEKEKAPGLDCGDKAAQWVQNYLNKEGLRLVYYHAEVLGRRDHTKPPFTIVRKVYRRYRTYDSGRYSDIAPFMLLNEASVADLKRRLGERAPPTLSESWFRGNLVVSGAEAYAEDNWNFLRIGDSAVFQATKPCTRCIMTTMDPENGKKTADMEPLKMLRSYRKVTDPEQLKVEGDSAPCMGVYLGLRRPGSVRTGDAVYISDE